MGKYITIIALSLFLISNSSCVNNNDLTQKSIETTEQLFDQVGKGGADDKFPKEYFDQKQTIFFLTQLKNYCDFANRKGKFIKVYYQNDDARGK